MRQTKLIPPPAAEQYLARARLDALASRILEVPVTIVRAAGGYGKTTQMRSWAEALSHETVVAWVTFERTDATTTGVLEAVNASFANACRGLGSGITSLLKHGDDRVDHLVAAVTNELLAWTEENKQTIVLFADDVQFALEDPGTAPALGAFVAALPPRVHVVFASRTPLKFSPLAKLRSSGRLFELDQTHLRFTEMEAREVGGHAAEIYYGQTEGWPIAVGLLGQLYEREPNRPELAFSGSRESVFEFLADDVVARLPRTLQASLEALAVPEQLDDEIAREYLQAQDAATIVGELERHGLYFTRNDNAWRLHALFREYLLDRLRASDPDRLRKYRVRYSELLRKQGRHMDALDEIIEAEAFEQIGEHVFEIFVSIRFTDRYRQLIRLLQRIPKRIYDENPVLYRAHAIALRRDNREHEAYEQLSICYEQAVKNGDPVLAFIAQIELGITVDDFYSLLRRDYIRSEKHFLRALQLAESPDLKSRPKAALDAHWHLAMVDAARGNFDSAIRHFDLAESLELKREDHRDNVLVEYAEILSWRGDWRRALEKAEFAEELFRRGRDQVYIGRALLMQARSLRVLGEDPSRAVQLANIAIETLQNTHQEEELSLAYVTLAMCLLDLEPIDVAAARVALHEAHSWNARQPNRSHEFHVALARYRLSSLTGSDEDSAEVCRNLRRIAAANDDLWQHASYLYCEADRLHKTDPPRSADAYRLAATEFEKVGDQYGRSLAEIGALAALVDEQGFGLREIVGLLNIVKARGVTYAFAAVPLQTAALAVRAVLCGATADVLRQMMTGSSQDVEALRSIALDEAVIPEARATAIRVLATYDVRSTRNVVRTIGDTADDTLRAGIAEIRNALPPSEVMELSVDVVGTLRVRMGTDEFDESDPRWSRKRSVELLRLLTVSDAALTRDAVITALWPENLSVLDTTFRVTLHLLRRALQPEVEGAGDYIVYDGLVVKIRPDVFAGSDVSRATRALRDAAVAFEHKDIANALEHVNVAVTIFSRAPREESVEDWLRPHVRAWREKGLAALSLQARVYSALGNANAEIFSLESAYQLDPLNESAVINLIDALSLQGRNDAAKRIYATYRRRLEEQLGIAPSPPLVERYARLLGKSKSGAQDPALSDREREVVQLIGRGRSNKEIAEALGLSVWTVNNHVAKILKKLKVASRSAAVVAAGVTAND